MRCLRTILNAPRLPVEFQEVEYIESIAATNDQPYINTGVNLQPNTQFDIEVAIVEPPNTWLWGTIWGLSSSSRYSYMYTTSTTVAFQTSGMSPTNISYTITFDKFNRYVFDLQSSSMTASMNGETPITRTGTLPEIPDDTKIFICRAQWGDALKGKIKKFKIFTNNVLVRDFVPCYRKSDNEVGMYDLVNNVFYTNAGTGSFIKGNDVNRVVSSIKSQVAYSILPTEYKQLEYIQSDGNQYIDTGVQSSNDIKIDANFSITNLDANRNYVFGIYNNSKGRIQFSYSSNAFYGWGDGYDNTNQLSVNTNTHNIIASKDNFLLDNNSVYIPSAYNFDLTNDIYLFGLNADGNASTLASGLKVFSCKIYNVNVLIRNFIPCYRVSDNEIGLYDRVNGIFYTNAGAGSFTAGSEVEPTLISSNTLRLSISELPNAYQEVEWIKSNGNAYINPSTNITADIGFEVTANIPSGTNGALLGNYLPGNYFFFVYSYTNNTTTFFPSKSASTVSMTVPRDTKTTFSFKNGVLYDGTTQTTIPTYATAEIGQPIYLFSGRPNNWFTSYKLYRCVIYNGSTAERDLRPCYRKSDNEIGLYDVINDVFYTNAGSGYFTKGNDI